MSEFSRMTWPVVMPCLTFTCDVNLNNILDLTNISNMSRLHLTPDDLECEWDVLQLTGAFVPTHHLAEMVASSGKFDAIKYESVRKPGGSNFVIYCDLIEPPNYVKVIDPYGKIRGNIPSGSTP